jgi:hypothetical protein
MHIGTCNYRSAGPIHVVTWLHDLYLNLSKTLSTDDQSFGHAINQSGSYFKPLQSFKLDQP